MIEEPMGIGPFIRERRTLLGLTQPQLEELSGINQKRISQIEQHDEPGYLPTIENMRALMGPLRCSMADFLRAAGYADESLAITGDPLADPDVRFYASQYSRMTEEKRAAVRAVIRAFAADQK